MERDATSAPAKFAASALPIEATRAQCRVDTASAVQYAIALPLMPPAANA